MGDSSLMDELIRLILQAVEALNPTLPRRVDTQKGGDAELFGRGGPLDSMALVSLIIEVETAIEDRFGVAVLLADERAVSRERSPFRTVGSFAGYAETVLTRAGVRIDP
jgi:hypothetical protein